MLDCRFPHLTLLLERLKLLQRLKTLRIIGPNSASVPALLLGSPLADAPMAIWAAQFRLLSHGLLALSYRLRCDRRWREGGGNRNLRDEGEVAPGPESKHERHKEASREQI